METCLKKIFFQFCLIWGKLDINIVATQNFIWENGSSPKSQNKGEKDFSQTGNF